MSFLDAFVAAVGTISSEDVTETAVPEPAEDVPKFFLFVVDPEGELHFAGTVAPDDPINLKVSARDAAGDVHLVSTRSTCEGCNQT